MKRMQFFLGLLGFAVLLTGAASATNANTGALPPLITVQAVHGGTNRPIKLAIRAPISVNGGIAFVLLSGVPVNAKLNLGVNLESGYWMVPARTLPKLTITIPQTGQIRIAVKLLDAHFRDASATAAFFVATNDAAALLNGE